MAKIANGESGRLTFEVIGFGQAHRWLECHAVPMRDRDNRITTVLCVMRDISDRKKAEQELERLAQTDALTNLANRRHFMALAEKELQRSDRYGSPLTLLMMDIDHFKRINDTHGHKCGDAVIRKFADICRESLRSLDIVGRIGGEEFAVLLPETDRNHALRAAEFLCRRVSQAEVPTDTGALIRFTVSIGLSSRNGKHIDLESFLAEADEALYQAKNTGRNRVCEHKADKNMPLRA
jgi:diguanylate cyclase (GGDEF)-like protein